MNLLGKDSSLVQRIVAGIIGAPFIVWFFYREGLVLFVFLVPLSILCQWELYRMFQGRVRQSQTILGYVTGTFILTDGFLNEGGYLGEILMTGIAAAFIIEIINREDHKLDNIALSLFAIFYPSVFISYMFRIDNLPVRIFGSYRQHMLLYMLLCIWIFDTASYFTGRMFGRHPFFPRISPKKTVEGFLGGLVGTMGAAFAFSVVFEPKLLAYFLMLTLVIVISGQIGDLSESIIKRDMNIKDSSQLIPGHGGILDRFDSLIFAGPVVYLFLSLLVVWGGFSQ